MQIFKISKSSLNHAVIILKKGGVVVYPTDTAYGFGADPWSVSAVGKIYKIKGRAKSKALPMIAASLSMVLKFFRVSKLEQALMKKYWPGPLSIILETRTKKLGAGNRYSNVLENIRIRVVVRVPKNKIAQELSRRLRRPIISTSANISGYGECYNAKEVFRQFKNRQHQPDLILNAGQLPKRKPSTIIKIEKRKIFVLRKGPINPTPFSKDAG